MNKVAGLIVILGPLLSACNGISYKDANVDYDAKHISFALVDQRIFRPRCMACHASPKSGFSCDCYQNVKARIADIERVALTDRVMPPGVPLSNFDAQLLRTWIAAGAPENGDGPPIPPDPPLEAKFDSIKRKIFIIRCIGCHSPGQPGHDVSLNTKEDLINSPRDLVVPGDSAESGLIIALVRKDAKRMPPPSAGDALSKEDIAVIAKWIDAGAKD
jgi:uncharacterized membrane protein